MRENIDPVRFPRCVKCDCICKDERVMQSCQEDFKKLDYRFCPVCLVCPQQDSCNMPQEEREGCYDFDFEEIRDRMDLSKNDEITMQARKFINELHKIEKELAKKYSPTCKEVYDHFCKKDPKEIWRYGIPIENQKVFGKWFTRTHEENKRIRARRNGKQEWIYLDYYMQGGVDCGE